MDENVVYREKVGRGEAHALLQPATALLKETLGPSWPNIKVEWDQEEDDRGRIQYALKLRDFAGATEAQLRRRSWDAPRTCDFAWHRPGAACSRSVTICRCNS